MADNVIKIWNIEYIWNVKTTLDKKKNIQQDWTNPKGRRALRLGDKAPGSYSK